MNWNCVVEGLSSCVDSTEVGIVGANEVDADVDGDVADLGAISAMVGAGRLREARGFVNLDLRTWSGMLLGGLVGLQLGGLAC